MGVKSKKAKRPNAMLNFFDFWKDMEKTEETAKIFATYPRENVSQVQALVTSITGTFLMVQSISAVTSTSNSFKPLSNLEPLFLGLAVFVYGITFSLNTGYAINPARDLGFTGSSNYLITWDFSGPRLFIYLAGFPNTFSRGNNVFDWYWWIPLVGPLVGASLASFSYQNLFVKRSYDKIISAKEDISQFEKAWRSKFQRNLPIDYRNKCTRLLLILLLHKVSQNSPDFDISISVEDKQYAHFQVKGLQKSDVKIKVIWVFWLKT